MKKISMILVLVVFALMVGINQAEAIILSGSLTGGSALSNGGTFVQLTPPIGNVGNNNHNTNNLYGFNEDQNITISTGLSADVGLTTLPVSTLVASHYIFFDPLQSRDAIGNVVFDADVLAIMTSTTNLINSDFLANVSANYLSPTLRGLESGDVVTINGSNPKQIDIDFTASSPGDYIRVLTARSPGAAVPEPATMMLLGSGLFGLVGLRRKK